MHLVSPLHLWVWNLQIWRTVLKRKWNLIQSGQENSKLSLEGRWQRGMKDWMCLLCNVFLSFETMFSFFLLHHLMYLFISTLPCIIIGSPKIVAYSVRFYWIPYYVFALALFYQGICKYKTPLPSRKFGVSVYYTKQLQKVWGVQLWQT